MVHLHQHMEELRQAALDMLHTFGGVERGYFTPTEDEQARHLLVSYWQSRNALFEVVHRFQERRAEPGSDEDRLHAFLVAYAAAVILVDAARFMRESFRDHAPIVSKLNEGEPHFGIPEGVYDTIQQSLTSPINAWHLYHANEHFDRHEKDLRAAARGDALMESALGLIDALGDRVRVSKADYAKARLKVRAEQIKRAVTDHAIGKAMYWVQSLCSRMVGSVMVRPGHEPALPGEILASLGPVLQPGDVFVTRKEYSATNYFLPGFWPHAALYLGDPESLTDLGLAEHQNLKPRWKRMLELDPEDPRRVLEAMGDGVWLRSIKSPFAVDAVAVIRPQLSAEDRATALGRGLSHEGKPYDFDFDFTRSDRLVCTEVVYRSYEGIGGLEFQLSRRAGRMTLAAEDLLRMAVEKNGFETVAVFAPGCCEGLCTGSAADDILRNTMGPPP